MRDRLAALARALAAKPAPPLALALGLAGFFGFHAARLGVDPGNEALFLEDDPAREGQVLLDRDFGGDTLIAVALEGPVLSAEGLGRLEALTIDVEDRLYERGFEVGGEQDPQRPARGRARVVSLTNAKHLYPSRAALAGVLAWAPYEWVRDGTRTWPDGEDRPYGPADFAAEVTRDPLFEGNLVAADGGMAAAIVTLEPPPGGNGHATGAPEAAVEALREAARAASTGGYAAHVAGFPVERYDFARLIARDQRVFIPLIVVMVAVVSGALFRQLWGVVLPLACVGLSVVVTSGAAALAGVAINAVTSLLQPVVMIVSVAASVNFAVAYAQAKGEGFAEGPDACGEGFRRVGPACLFTTLTTVMGFGALALSEVPAIRDFGALSALGVAVSYLAAWLVMPPFFGLRFARGPRSLALRAGRLDALLGGLAPWIARRRGAVLAGFGLAIAVAGAGIARLRVETDILAQLPPRSELAVATRAIEARLGGVNALELLFEGEPGAFRRLEPLQALARAQASAEGRRDRGVRKTLSLVDVLARFREVRGGPRELPVEQEELDYAFGLLDQAGAEAPTRMMLSPDGGAARLSVRLRSMPASQVYALIQDLSAEAARLAPTGVRVRPAGSFVLLQDMTHALPRSQLRGVALATAAIIFSIALLFRSLRLGALAALPAAAPVLGAYGLMGWLGIDLSTATSMIASVVVGLAVDAAILLLARYRDERGHGAHPPAAVAATLRSAGASVTFSNLTLVGGFSIGALSSFPPVRDFAVLTAATIASTYIAAIVLLPALVLATEPGPAP